jgi:hypothetical protein
MIRRIANVAAFCAAAIICYGMQASKPHYADLTGPIPAYGGMADTVETRLFDVHVDKIVFAHTLKVNEFGTEKTLTTGGLWAVVATDLAARDQSTLVGSATWLGPTGLRFRQTERLSFAPGMPPHGIDPGLPKKGRFVFEIQPGEARGATLLVSSTLYFALDSQARIALDDFSLAADGTPAMIVPVYDLDQPI